MIGWPFGVCALAARRTATPWMLAAFLALAIFGAKADWAPPATLFVDSLRSSVERGMARQGLWTVWLLAFAPLLLFKNAHTIARWRSGESAWLGAAPVTGTGIVGATWAGFALAALGWLGATALWVESCAGVASQGLGYVDTLAVPRIALLESNAPERWQMLDPRLCSDREVRAHLALAGGGASAEVRMRGRRDGGPWTETARRVAGRATLHLPVPPGSGAVEFELERRDGAGIVVLDPRGLDLLQPVASENRASLAIGARVWLALAAAAALALGLGAWLPASTATLLVLCLALPDWLGSCASAWWPWSDLPRNLELVGQGLAPPFPAVRTWLGTLAAVLLGTALAGRHPYLWKAAP